MTWLAYAVWRDGDGDAQTEATRNERRVKQVRQQDDEYSGWFNQQRNAPFYGHDPFMHAPPEHMPCPPGQLAHEGSHSFTSSRFRLVLPCGGLVVMRTS